MTSESELIERARHFDQDALAEIYDRFSPGIYRYALHLLDDSQLAEDCTADTFTRYLQALQNNGGPQDHLQAYLYRIAHNQLIDAYRREPLPPVSLLDEFPGGEPEPLQTVTEHIDQQAVRSALKFLTPDQRQVIVLKYLACLENETVAQVLKKPIGTIKSLQHRAISTLRRILQSQMEEAHEGTE
jgi:RNA polymerase sigma factor, sigma-70 family